MTCFATPLTSSSPVCLEKLMMINDKLNSQDIIRKIEQIQNINHYLNEDGQLELSTEISYCSGSFNHVFLEKEYILKTLSQKDRIVFFDAYALNENFLDDFSTLPVTDYEVLLTLGDNPYTPKLYGYYVDDETENLLTKNISIVECIKGDSLAQWIQGIKKRIDEAYNTEDLSQVIEDMTLKCNNLEVFIKNFINYSLSKGYLPIDLASQNIIVKTDSQFSIIDFSCFIKKSNNYHKHIIASGDVYDMLENIWEEQSIQDRYINCTVNELLNVLRWDLNTAKDKLKKLSQMSKVSLSKTSFLTWLDEVKEEYLVWLRAHEPAFPCCCYSASEILGSYIQTKFGVGEMFLSEKMNSKRNNPSHAQLKVYDEILDFTYFQYKTRLRKGLFDFSEKELYDFCILKLQDDLFISKDKQSQFIKRHDLKNLRFVDLACKSESFSDYLSFVANSKLFKNYSIFGLIPKNVAF